MKQPVLILLGFLLGLSSVSWATTFENLTSPNPTVRSKALFDVEKLDEEGRNALLPKLIKELRIGPLSQRRFILNALKRMGPFAAEAIPDVQNLVEEEERTDYSPALQTLASMGEKAVPALIEIQKKKRKKRKAIFLALGNMGPTAKEAKPTLKKFLKKRDPAFRFEVARALIRIDPTTQAEMIPVLIDLIGQSEKALLSNIAETLGAMGTDAAVAIPSLIPGLKDSYANYAVCLALIKMGPDRKDVKESLLAELSAEREEGGSYGAELALSRYGNKILPDLEKRHKDGTAETKKRVEETLKKIGTEDALKLIKKFREKP